MFGRVLWVLVAMSVSFSLYIIALAGFKVFGPSLEQAFVRPVTAIRSVSETSCVGDDLVFVFFLDKTIYSGGLEAQLTSLHVRAANGDALAWRPMDTQDQSAFSAPGGQQVRSMYIVGGCSVEFSLLTRHTSPITGLVLRNEWGLYGPYQ